VLHLRAGILSVVVVCWMIRTVEQSVRAATGIYRGFAQIYKELDKKESVTELKLNSQFAIILSHAKRQFFLCSSSSCNAKRNNHSIFCKLTFVVLWVDVVYRCFLVLMQLLAFATERTLWFRNLQRSSAYWE